MEDTAIKIYGHWSAKVIGPDGAVKGSFEDSKNVICTNGKEFLANFLQSTVTGAAAFDMTHIAVGTDNTAAAAANTALGTEVARIDATTVSYTSGAIYEITGTFTTGTATGAIVEYGILSSSSAGTMLSRNVEDVINVGAADQLVVTAQITFS
jgi:hypothetical protein